MSTNLALIEGFRPDQHSIEECLAELEKYGLPRLSKLDRGWHAGMDVFVTGKGVKFEVCSNFGHQEPQQALNLCYERLVVAIEKIKKGESS